MIARWLWVALLGSGLCAVGSQACRGGAPATGAGGGGSSASSPVGGGSTGGGMSDTVGDKCLSDADCSGLTCIPPTADDPVLGGGPANGYCSAKCSSDGDCPDDSLCLLAAAGGKGDCVMGCTLGPALVDVDDDISADGKCRERNDVRCTAVNATTRACLPTCGEDTQCPAGRVCDPRLAVCVDTPSAGLPAGSICNALATTSGCAGVCVSFMGSNDTMCSSPCELGGDPDDATGSPSCGGVTRGLCAFVPPGNGAGDYGFCSPACSTQDDCQTPSFWCFALPGITGVNGVTNGYCFQSTPCRDGPDDCTQLDGATCVQTTYGPQCLSGGFPLGSTAPDGGTDGGDDGGTGGGGGGGGGGGDAGDGG
jgi:hypothetical protein